MIESAKRAKERGHGMYRLKVTAGPRRGPAFLDIISLRML